jgi:oxygen-dependent protoporphyrinogen oxidase
MPGPSPPHVAVVGGGIAGLAAAWFLRQRAGERIRVSVLERSDQVGGKLRLAEVAGLQLDAGAEALLARRPEALALARAVGLGDELLHPATAQAGVWTRGRIRRLPAGHIMGVPTDLRALARSGVLTPSGLARARLERLLPMRPYDSDVSVGAFVGARFGREVVDRLVEPLLGGVYAGHADRLSLDATTPQLAADAHAGRRVRAAAVADAGPVFAGIRGGVGRLPAAVARASGADIRTNVTVRQLCRTPSGWRLVTGPTRRPEHVDADAVVLALPARPASRLLADVVPSAAADLAAIEYASVALVTLVVAPDALTRPLAGSGFLVPPMDGRLVKAATYATAKWPWLADQASGLTVIRVSVGRHGEEHDVQRDDDDLVRLAAADLATAAGVRGTPVDALVTRWGGSLPQYEVGHLDRVRRIREAIAGTPGLAVCGAAYDGIGVAACIASADVAVTQVLARQ